MSASVAEELHRLGCAAEYGIPCSRFIEILVASATKASGDCNDPAALEAFCRAIKLEELALARGCAAGNEKAWEVFLNRFREKLYDAARRITHEESSARELADSIYSSLYASGERDGQRTSKLEHYHGRGSLEGWLRTVLAQEWVDRYRKNKRLVSLEEQEEAGGQFAAREPEATVSPVAETALESATDRALAALPAEDRYILSTYFLDGRNLKDVARTLGVHESTISRKVEKLARGLRKQIMDQLQKSGMSRRQAEETMEMDVRDLTLDVRRSLATTANPPPE